MYVGNNMVSNGRLRVLEEDFGLVPPEPKPEEPKEEPVEFKTSGQTWTANIKVTYTDGDKIYQGTIPDSPKPRYVVDKYGGRRVLRSGIASDSSFNEGLSRLIDEITEGADPNDLPQYGDVVVRSSNNTAWMP